MRKPNDTRDWVPCVALTLLAASVLGLSSPVEAQHCVSARSAARLAPLAAQDSPDGHQSPEDHCFSGTLRGPLKGTMIVCMPESECALDENLCTCDPGTGLWSREGEGGAMAYRARVWFVSGQGGFEAIERGIQVENTGYPGGPYPGPRHYWAGIMQVLPGSGSGAFEGVSHGTILIHNEWNDPGRVKLAGEVCMP